MTANQVHAPSHKGQENCVTIISFISRVYTSIKTIARQCSSISVRGPDIMIQIFEAVSYKAGYY